jgi:hypothetical protein
LRRFRLRSVFCDFLEEATDGGSSVAAVEVGAVTAVVIASTGAARAALDGDAAPSVVMSPRVHGHPI